MLNHPCLLREQTWLGQGDDPDAPLPFSPHTSARNKLHELII